MGYTKDCSTKFGKYEVTGYKKLSNRFLVEKKALKHAMLAALVWVLIIFMGLLPSNGC